MDYQNWNKGFNSIVDFWVYNLVKILNRHGNIVLSKKIILNALKLVLEAYSIEKTFTLNIFFHNITENLYTYLTLRCRYVAGQKVFIPARISVGREIYSIIHTLLKNSRKRFENKVSHRIAFELIDAFNNEGISYKYYVQRHNEIFENIANIRFLLVY